MRCEEEERGAALVLCLAADASIARRCTCMHRPYEGDPGGTIGRVTRRWAIGKRRRALVAGSLPPESRENQSTLRSTNPPGLPWRHTGAFVPHSGQNLTVSGILAPHSPQKRSFAVGLPHSGQNLA